MLIVSGTYRINPDHMDRLRQFAVPMLTATRAEPGCIEYEFSEVIDAPGTIRLWELWESREALDAHFATDHMGTWRENVGSLDVLGRDVSTYEGIDAITEL